MLVKLASALPGSAAEGGETSAANHAPQEEVVTLAPEEGAPEREGGGGESTHQDEPYDERCEDSRGEGEGDEKPDDDADPDKPQKLSRNQRKNRKLAEQAARIRDLENRLTRHQDNSANESAMPRPEDFAGNFPAFARAMRAYEVRRAVRDETARGAQAAAASEAHQTRMSAYNERLSEVQDRIPDFEETLDKARRVDIRDDVRDLILESAKGPLLAYHLAKNPEKIAALNRMSQLTAAREIGRLEARIRGPQPKRQTSAPPPISSPRGGTGGVAKKVEHMSMDEFIRERDAGRL